MDCRYAFTTDVTLPGWAIGTARDAIPGFEPKTIRSGDETILAEAGVTKEVRGRVQRTASVGFRTAITTPTNT